jgi:hypothetical protein
VPEDKIPEPGREGQKGFAADAAALTTAAAAVYTAWTHRPPPKEPKDK